MKMHNKDQYENAQQGSIWKCTFGQKTTELCFWPCVNLYAQADVNYACYLLHATWGRCELCLLHATWCELCLLLATCYLMWTMLILATCYLMWTILLACYMLLDVNYAARLLHATWGRCEDAARLLHAAWCELCYIVATCYLWPTSKVGSRSRTKSLGKLGQETRGGDSLWGVDLPQVEVL